MNETTYANGYVYITFRKRGDGLIYCAGVNITRFRPLTWGTHGQFMNPAFRGLQLLRLKFLIPSVQEAGGRVKRLTTAECGEVPGGDGWFRESFEITGVPPAFGEKTLRACVSYLVEVILKVARPGLRPPEDVTDPTRLEQELDSLSGACTSQP